MKPKPRNCPGCRKETCTGCGIFKKLNTNKHISAELPKYFLPEKQGGFGIAFDLGTTTLAGMLWDLEQAVCLGAKAVENPQSRLGMDVVSRLQAAIESEEQLLKLQQMVVQALDKLAFELVNKQLGQYVEPVRAVVAGNTAMCQLLLKRKPEKLVRSPFKPDYQGLVCQKGDALGFRFLKNTEIVVMPPVGGYAGADILAVYTWICKEYKEDIKNLLAVDIGTNGEILLFGDKEHYVCSAAAGPALEGGGALCGMRAAKGAVDMVSVNGSFPMQDLVCRVIGEGKPKGICGSGLLDTMAVLGKVGILDDTGYMRSQSEAKAAGTPQRIAGRIEESHKGRRILLTDKEHPVYLYAGDVRQVQLAVGALRAGIEVLLERADMQSKELEKIYLAGAFGSYIRVDSCMSIGLLPQMDKEKVIQAGNLAGMGASMALLSPKVMEEMVQQAKKLLHVELAGNPRFEELFLKYMYIEEERE